MQNAKNISHLKSLDSLRGVFALFICLFHAKQLFDIRGLFHHAYLAVDYFFALSGFVLFIRYLSKDQNAQNVGMSLRDFMINRISRIYPLYFLATILGIGFIFYIFYQGGTLAMRANAFISSIVQSLLVIPNFNSEAINKAGVVYPFAFQAWTIFWEFVISIIFFYQIRFGWKLELFFAIIAFMLLLYFTAPLKAIEEGWRAKNFHIGGLRAIYGLNIGLLSGRVFLYLLPKISNIGKFIAASLAFGLLFIFIYYVIKIKYQIYWLEAAIALGFFPIMIIGFALSRPILLEHNLGKFFGETSFALYLLHGIFVMACNYFARKFQWDFFGMEFGFYMLLAMYILSFIVFKFYEKPMAKFVKNILTK